MYGCTYVCAYVHTYIYIYMFICIYLLHAGVYVYVCQLCMFAMHEECCGVVCCAGLLPCFLLCCAVHCWSELYYIACAYVHMCVIVDVCVGRGGMYVYICVFIIHIYI